MREQEPWGGTRGTTARLPREIRIGSSLWAVAAALVYVASGFCHAQITKDVILERFCQTNRLLPPHAMHIETAVSLRTNGDWGEPEVYAVELRRDGDKIDYTAEQYLPGPEGKKNVFKTRSIWTGAQYIARQQSGDGTASSFMAMASNTRDPAYAVLTSQSNGAFLDGFFETRFKHCSEVVRASPALRVQAEQEEVQGHLCTLIQGRTDSGDYKLWFDPDHGFALRKAIIEKGPGDTLFGQPLQEVYPTGESRTVRVRIEVNDVTVAPVGGYHIPLSGTMVLTRIQEDGSKVRLRYVCRRSNIQVNPDFARTGAFEMDGIPNGARVRHLDFPGIRYVWHDGQLVSDVDQVFRETLDREIERIEDEPEVRALVTTQTSPDKPVDARPVVVGAVETQAEDVGQSHGPKVLVLLGIGLVIAGAAYWVSHRHSRTNRA